MNKIILDSVLEHKSLIFSFICLLGAYLMQDIIFVKEFSKFITTIPDFLKDINLKKIMNLIVPYISASLLFYIDDIIQAKVFPEVELNVIKELTNQTLESIRTTKKTININEFMLNLKKIPDLRNVYYIAISYVVPTLLLGIGLFYYYAKSGLTAGSAYLIIMTLLVIITYSIECGCINYARTSDNKLNDYYDDIQDIMINFDTVITSNTKEKEMENINTVKTDCKHHYVRSEIENSEALFKLESLNMVMMIALDGVIVKQYIDKKVELDDAVAVIMMVSTFMQYYNSTIVRLKNVMGHLGKYFELQDYFAKFEIDNDKIKKELSITNGDIIFENINLSYENKVILDDFNLRIKGNQIFGIVGKIGTGKTSLIKMIAGLIPYDGKIYIDNQDIDLFSRQSISNVVAYIPQNVKLFNRSIYENINYGSNYSEKYIWSIINKYKLIDFYKSFNDGLKTNVGKEGSKLSGGQKQIVAITRALIQDKKIILLDEPTASLDPKFKDYVIDLLKVIKGKTIIIITHDKSLNDLFDDMIKFN